MGYAQSKLVAEQILHEAAMRSNLSITVLRIGQVAGSTLRDSAVAWPVRDWLPLTIATSKTIGYLPDLGVIDWIPIDHLVQVVAELMDYDLQSEEYHTYNLVNPRATAWSDLLQPVLDCCGLNTEVIPMAEWLLKVKEAEFSNEEIASIPIAKMVDSLTAFLAANQHSGPNFKIEKALIASPSMRSLMPIDKAMMESWVKQWGF